MIPGRTISSRSVLKKPAVVIDLGSAFIRCGFAGEPRPIHVIPSVIGDSTAKDGVQGARTRDEWERVLTGVFSRLYTESLQCRPRERRVIVCESMVSPRALREAVAHILFDYLQVPSLHIIAGPTPALYCTGLDTGIVLDVGSREAHVVAVYRGAPLTTSYSGVPLGLRAVQERAGELIAEEEAREQEEGRGGEGRRRSLTYRELEDVAVRACLVPVGGVPSAQQVSPMKFMFSGRRTVTASAAVRTCAVQEALFEGDGEGRSLATLVLDCLYRCPRDCRRALVQNVIVAGGTSLLPGLCARLGEEIKALAAFDASSGGSGGDRPAGPAGSVGKPEGYAWARTVVSGEGVDGDKGLCVMRAPVRRDLLLWTGASIMGCLEGVEEKSLSREQYLARGGGGGGRLPDWMSVSPADWVF